MISFVLRHIKKERLIAGYMYVVNCFVSCPKLRSDIDISYSHCNIVEKGTRIPIGVLSKREDLITLRQLDGVGKHSLHSTHKTYPPLPVYACYIGYRKSRAAGTVHTYQCLFVNPSREVPDSNGVIPACTAHRALIDPQHTGDSLCVTR